MIFAKIGDTLQALSARLPREVRQPAGGGYVQLLRNIPNLKQSVADMSSLNYRLALCLTAALLQSSCVIVPDQRHYAGGVVMVAPPPPREEVIDEPPVPGYVWLGGYWSWVGDRHEWVPGHWSAPRAGRHWVSHQWVRQGDGWRLKPGHWQRG